jgi:site-specific recombinase XerD
MENAKQKLRATIKMIDGAYAPSTIRAYKSNFLKFIDYCEIHQENALPASPEIICEFIKEISDGRLKSSTVRIALASISAIHRLNRISDPCEDPIVKIEMRRTNRKLGRHSNQAYGITNNVLQSMISTLKSNLKSTRDKAILLLAYDGMCRRSEIISIKFEDLEITYSKNVITDLKVKLRKSKTDQESVGRTLYTSPACKQAIIEWLKSIKNKRRLFVSSN